MPSLLEKAYNPDVLTCLANLSNDEVFTPPELANDVLDMLPPEIWSDPTIKILDPCCKSGVFLREAAKRFIKGLEHVYPDLQERVEHIMHEQLFGIAITELTSLLSRRSLYCSKFPNGRFSVAEFDSSEGNVRHRTIQHTWVNNRCKYCGASNAEYDRDATLETHAYEFIHTGDPERILNMKFDVIVGNPPYQLGNQFDNQQRDRPIYHLFVENAKRLLPRHLCMIIPARWFTGTWNLGDFPRTMLNDRRIKELHDFPNASDCFPGVEIKGGVCYFHWDRDHAGDCKVISHVGNSSSTQTRPLLEPGEDIFIRNNEGIPIYHKVKADNTRSFTNLVSPQNPFGFRTNHHGRKKRHDGDIPLICRGKEIEYISKSDIKVHTEWIDAWKVLIPEAGEGGALPNKLLGKPFIAGPGTCCTGTYLLLGPFRSKEECSNVISYIQTTFFRFLISLKKITQHTNRTTYSLIPLVEFDRPWTDSDLCKRYGISDSELSYMESLVTPMVLDSSAYEDIA